MTWVAAWVMMSQLGEAVLAQRLRKWTKKFLRFLLLVSSYLLGVNFFFLSLIGFELSFSGFGISLSILSEVSFKILSNLLLLDFGNFF